ncbi:MAG: flagellar basal body-associated FliL family protein, partial [Caulobacteraceae bacterium]
EVGEEAPAEAVAAEDGAEGEAKPKKKGLPLKMLVIAGVGALVVLGGGGATAFIMLKPKPDAHAAKGKGEHAKPKKPKKGEHGEGKDGANKNEPVISEGPDGVVFYTLPDLVVNMQGADGRPSFLKLKLTFELPDQETADAIGPNRPRLQDMFTTFLRELRPEDVSGSQGSYRLRMEIQRRVNLVIAPAKINAVLIEEMLIN